MKVIHVLMPLKIKMSISKKGLRKITVDNCEYVFKISKYKKCSAWKSELQELDDEFLKYAKFYGLGSIMDVVFNIVISINDEHQKSSLFIKYYSIVIDGFLGPDQISEIKPKLISKLIRKAVQEGWNPCEKSDFRYDLVEKFRKDKANEVFQIVNGVEIALE